MHRVVTKKDKTSAKESKDNTIQALRGIAVISVVVYHSMPDLKISGYLGVDVFFVISGYLITKNIITKLKLKKFSLIEYTSKRIYRIFPALLVTLALSTFFGIIVLYPEELRNYSKSLVAGTIFLSNFMLAREPGYFDKTSDELPLLHLWSLSVEWQFYFFWPVIVFLVFRGKKPIENLLLSCLIILFPIYLFYSFTNPNLAFYLPWSRVWQFALGALIFAIKKEVTLKFGLGKFLYLSLIACLLFGDRLLTSYLAAVFVTLISGSIIYFANSEFVNLKILLKLLIFFGNISYSFYLVHWPAIVYCRLIYPQNKFAIFITVVVVTFFSYLLTKFVEDPFRKKRNGHKTAMLLSFSMFILCLCSLIYFFNPNVQSKISWSPKPIKIGDTGQEIFFDAFFSDSIPCNGKLLYENSPKFMEKLRCVQKESGFADITLIGDSHAEVYYPGLSELFDVNIKVIVRDGQPLVSNPNYKDVFASNLTSDLIILTGRWYLEKNFEDNFYRTLIYLSSLQIPLLVLGDVPNFSFSAESCKFERFLSNFNICSENVSLIPNIILRQIIEDAGFYNVQYLDPSKYFCKNSLCSMSKNDKIYYRDNNHLNLIGSRLVAHKIKEMFASQWALSGSNRRPTD
jgi:peptidoglycan/LPS O-acetylase OafA/YrhL